MGKFIEVQVVVRQKSDYKHTYVGTQEALLNVDDISTCIPYNSGTLITLRSVSNTVELADSYEDIRYKLFTDEVH